MKDGVPLTKPKWLSSKYSPKNDGKFEMQDEYPKYNKISHPVEWAR